jgi:hypothetical protein
MFTALKHPIRRKILRIVSQSPVTYTTILNQLGIDNGLLNYHLENMRALLAKDDEERYHLSEFGKASINLIQRVEEIPAAQKPMVLGLNTKQVTSVLLILIIGLASVSTLLGVSYNDHQQLGNVLAQTRSQLDLTNQRLQNISYLQTLTNITKSPTAIVPSYFMTFNYDEGPPLVWDQQTSIIVYYVPVDGSVTRLELIVPSSNRYTLELTLQDGNAWKNETWVRLGTVDQVYGKNQNASLGSRVVWQAPIEWSMNVSDSGVYVTPPLSRGWHTLSMFGPITLLDKLVARGEDDYYRYPMFHGSVEDPSASVKMYSYSVAITAYVQKNNDPIFFAVENRRY